MDKKQDFPVCGIEKKCGGCSLQGVAYGEQLRKKQDRIGSLLSSFCAPEPILGMEDPYYYRNKVHHVFARTRSGEILSGCYEADSHRVVNVERCLIEDRKCQEVIATVRKLLKSFRIRIYDEDSGQGLLRHVLMRRGFSTGELMAVLVLSSPIFPGKNNFIKALRTEHPELTTIVFNINDRDTSMVLGERNITVYGPGFIRDRLLGLTFRISPSSFYQVNPVQTEKLYRTAVAFAGLTGKERVIDAYCGTGTIGLCAAAGAKEVIGIELNRGAAADARRNAKENGIQNASFLCGDAGQEMLRMAQAGEKADLVFLDPPRSGSTETFFKSMAALGPSRVVYISCNPDTLKRDLYVLKKYGYKANKLQPVDLFPFTDHVECVVSMSRIGRNEVCYGVG